MVTADERVTRPAGEKAVALANKAKRAANLNIILSFKQFFRQASFLEPRSYFD